MRLRADIGIAAVIVLLCAWAVAKQFGYDPFSDGRPDPLEVGATLDMTQMLMDVGDKPQPVGLHELAGKTATVFYSWSTFCPCIAAIEPRMKQLYAGFNENKNGVSWIALAGEPKDNRDSVRKLMGEIGSCQYMLLDPQQQVCGLLGFTHAAQVVVVDPKGTILYRGAIDDDYEEPTRGYLREVLAAIVVGKPVPFGERARTYGCAFDDPASCELYEEGIVPASSLSKEGAEGNSRSSSNGFAPATTPADTPTANDQSKQPGESSGLTR